MKKRIFMITTACALVISAVFGLCACGGKKITSEDWAKLLTDASNIDNFKLEIVETSTAIDKGDLVADKEYTDANGVSVNPGDYIDLDGNKVKEPVKGDVEVAITRGMVYKRAGNLAYFNSTTVGYNDNTKNLVEEYYLEYENGTIKNIVIQNEEKVWVRTAVLEEELSELDIFTKRLEFLKEADFSDFKYGGAGYKYIGDTKSGDMISDLADLQDKETLDFIIKFNAKGISGYDWIIKKAVGKSTETTDSARLSEVGSTKIKLPKTVK